MIAARPWTIGFSVRSAIGRCSSSSSRVRGRTEICCSRACTGSSCWPTRNEANTRKTPKATTPASTRISTLDLDVRDVSTDLRLDADGGDHEVEVVAFDPADEVRERLLHAQAEVHLADDAPQLRAHRRGRFTRHELDRLEEARARAQGVREQHDR